MKITKKFKGVLSLALTAMLALGSITTNATTTNESKDPYVDPNAKGSIIIHKYGVDTIPNPGTPADGLEIENTEGLGTPLPNVSFNIYKVPNDTTNVDQVTDEIKENLIETITTGDSGENLGVAKTGKLELGVYYVEEVYNPSISKSVEPFLVSIPMAHPTENEWIYDVHVYPKNIVDKGQPTIDKSVTTSGNKHDSANINQDVLWIIEPQIPRDIATAIKYEITDTLDNKLTYKVFGGISFINSSNERITLEENVHYELTEPSEEKGGTLKIKFTAEGKKQLATALVEGQPLPTVQISFTTVINEDAKLGEEIFNNASLDYTNTVGQIFEPIDVPGSGNEKPEVHTGGLLLEKVDAADSTIKLEGAKFKIYPTLVDAQNGINAILNPENDEEWEVTTVGNNGQAIFRGLAYGTYYIVETVAPKYDSNGDGQITDEDKSYNILKKPLEVTVNAASHEESNKVVVANSKFTLPVTGGVGTVIFTLGGLAIMGAAALLYMRTIRRA